MSYYIRTAAELLVLILCVGFFTSSETAYLSLPRLKLRSMVEQGRRHAKRVAALKANMDRLLTTVLIGTNFLNSLASAIATALAIDILGSKGTAIAARKGGKIKTVGYVISGFYALFLESLVRLDLVPSFFGTLKIISLVLFIICVIASYASFIDYLIHFGKILKSE